MVVALDACAAVPAVSGTAAAAADAIAAATGTAPVSAAPMWSIDTVDAVGTPVPAGDARGLAGIVVDSPAADNAPGALLLDPAGQVLGMLDQPMPTTLELGSAAAADVFLTGQLVAGVTHQLEAGGAVRRGWLDVTVRDAPPSTTGAQVGAAVVSVNPGGAAAGLLRVGDVIDAVSGAAVRSMAELRTRLYVLSPGTPVTLGVRRDGRHLAVTVDLGGTP
jgi:hypothetical protein